MSGYYKRSSRYGGKSVMGARSVMRSRSFIVGDDCEYPFVRTILGPSKSSSYAIQGDNLQDRLRKMFEWIQAQKLSADWTRYHKLRWGELNLSGQYYDGSTVYTVFPKGVGKCTQFYCILCEGSVAHNSGPASRVRVRGIPAAVCQKCPVRTSICAWTFRTAETCAEIQKTFALCLLRMGITAGMLKLLKRYVDPGCMCAIFESLEK